MTITIRYRAVDGYSLTRRFKSRMGALQFAVHCVGNNPDFGSDYAVADDGVGTIRAEGISLAALYNRNPAETDPEAAFEAERIALERADFAALVAEAEAFHQSLRPARASGCVCSDAQLDRVGCDCSCDGRWPVFSAAASDLFDDHPF